MLLALASATYVFLWDRFRNPENLEVDRSEIEQGREGRDCEDEGLCNIFFPPLFVFAACLKKNSRLHSAQKSSWDDWKDDNPAGSGNTGANLG